MSAASLLLLYSARYTLSEVTPRSFVGVGTMKNPSPDEEARRALENQVHRLLRQVRKQQETITRLQRDRKLLVRSVYRFPGELFDQCWSSRSWDFAIDKVQEKFREFDGNPEGWQQLVQFLDEHLDHVVSDLASCPRPRMKEQELHLFCYCVLGFSASRISTLMGIENRDAVYSRKGRLIRKIGRMGPDRAKRFLDLMD